MCPSSRSPPTRPSARAKSASPSASPTLRPSRSSTTRSPRCCRSTRATWSCPPTSIDEAAGGGGSFRLNSDAPPGVAAGLA
eukprot:1446188-Prymnesium_polylepis.1